MDDFMIFLFIGLILTGVVAGIPIGQAFEHRRLLRAKQNLDLPIKAPMPPSRSDRILEAEEIS